MADHAGEIRVLHVDDEPEFGELAVHFLESEDDRFEVVAETCAPDGLERLREGSFDCIVSDYQMPEQDGLAFLTAVRDDYPELPFILFTGQGSEEIASKAITAGVTDYLQKGYGTDQYTILANRIANAVERYRALRQTDLSYRAMETAREGLSFVESDGSFSYVNTAFAGLFGYEPDELVGEQWTVLYHQEEAKRLENDILPAVRETGYWSGETVRLTKGGERLVTDHRLAHTDEGVIVCTAQDLTAERSAPGEHQNVVDVLVDTMEGYAFYTLDHEGYVTRWNEGARRLQGYEADEILGEPISTFFTDADRREGVPEQLLEAAEAEGSIRHEGWRLRKDGTRFWAEVTLAPSYDDAGTLRGFGNVMREAPEQSVTH